MTRLLVFVLAGAGVACAQGPFDEAQTLGGVEVSAADLNAVLRFYERYCLVCHGRDGDGNGPSAKGLVPAPRDFRTATFKFAGIEDRGLPADAELERIIGTGLPGSAMVGADLPRKQLWQVAQYLKTFSPPGKGFRDPRLVVKPPVIPADPNVTLVLRAAAVARGETLYHTTFMCNQCHPSYVGADRYRAWKLPLPRPGAPRSSVPKWSPTYREALLPPDFERHRLRSVRARNGELDGGDLYRVIAYGLQGPMPGYGHLGAADIWAVVHYLKFLAERAAQSPRAR